MSVITSDSDKLREIIAIDSELNKIQDQDILLERILSVARRITNADAGSIYIKRDNNLDIKYAQNDTLQKDLDPGQKLIYKFFTLPVNSKSIAGYCASEKKLLNIPDYYGIPKDAPYSHNAKYDKDAGYLSKSMLAIPLLNNMGACLGVLQIINKMDDEGELIAFTNEDEQLVRHFAVNVVIALEKAQMTRAILQRMVQMAELRDPKETGPHVNRVAGFSVELYDRWAFKMGIPEHKRNKDRDIFRMASMLHDVGKVGISDTILKKPGRFDEDEYSIMKSHTLIGARLFRDSQSEFDQVAQTVVLNHHENWDGTGYPGHIDLDTGNALKTDEDGRVLGKKGTEIPVFGRIVAIADVYDALRCKRVYKEAWKEEDVLEEIRKLSGTKFDPDLVDIFFEVYDRLQTVADQYPDESE
ncbi:HD domain-containing phosphohydrolase [Salinispira pacifica]|uniref:HD domain-containing phosphohydrolase n=1 Tax=Salinispira pacifica TaxID=1307761 RepID=UPI00059BF0C3